MSFVALCAAVAAERVVELLWSHRKRRTGRLPGERAWPAMVAVHTATLVAAPLEAILASQPPAPRWLRRVAAGIFLGATLLRVWTLRSLGDSWNVRVLQPTRIVTRGPYR